MWMNRSKLIFLASLGMAGIMLLQMGLYGLHVLFGWNIGYNLLQICNNWMRAQGIFSVVQVLNALVLYTLASAGWTFARQLWLTRRTFRKLLRHRTESSSGALYTGDLGDDGVILVDSPKPFAFTMGLWRPRIFLSTGLLQILEPREVEAVLNHERFHRQHGDPLKTFALSMVASVFWYIPLLRWLYVQYKTAREILADRFAIARQGSSAALGGALLKLLKLGPPPRMPFAYASFADTSVNDRIRQLIDPQAAVSLRPPVTPTVISIHVLLGLSALLLLASF